MRRILADIAGDLTRSRRALLAIVAQVEQPALDRRPAPDAWSPGEVLDHVATVETSIARLFARGVAQAAVDARAPDSDDPAVLRSLDAFSVERVVEPVRSRSEPRPGRPKAELESELLRSRAALRAAIDAAGEYGIGHIRYPHASLGMLDLYQWLLFVARHDDRHRTQIERALG